MFDLKLLAKFVKNLILLTKIKIFCILKFNELFIKLTNYNKFENA